MRLLVTGGRGYIGVRLVAALRSLGHEVRALHRGPVEHPDEVTGDVRDPDIWKRVLPGIGAVIHLAAQTSSAVSDRDPVADLEANVAPVLRLLEASRSLRVQTIVLASTSTIFGLPKESTVTEKTPSNPLTTYDLHKAFGEQYLERAARLGWVGGAALRLCNVYGPGPASSSADRGVINQMIRKSLRGEALTQFGDGVQLRDYVFIDDVVNAFVLAATSGETLGGHSYVIGSGVGTSLATAIATVAARGSAIIGRPIVIDRVSPPPGSSPNDARNFVADSTAFRRLTGWRAQTSFSDGIDMSFAAMASHV